MTDILDQEIKAFEGMKPELEKNHFGKFVIIKDKQLVGSFDNFDSAAESALKKFGRGPYLIRQVGSPPITFPASLAYRVMNAAH